MRYVDGPWYTEIHPETRDDYEKLRTHYPHCFPCAYICVMHQLVRLPVSCDAFGVTPGEIREFP